jgi:hypothetical protein
MDYYSVISKKDVIAFTGKWLGLPIIMHMQKDEVACYLSYMEVSHTM